MRACSLLVVLALAACSGEPARPDAYAPVVEPAPPPEPELLRPGALRESAWTFHDPVGPVGCGLWGGGTSTDCDPHFVGDPRVYHARGGRLVREDAGAVVFDVPLDLPAGATSIVVGLEIEPRELRVAAVVDGDVVVARRNAEDGALVAVHRIAHPGSPATQVQLEGGDGSFVVRALAERPWSAMLDADSGALVDRAEVGVTLAEFARDAPGHAWQRTLPSVSASGVTVRRGHARAATWDLALVGPSGCGAYALFELESELAIVHHCRATSGAMLAFVSDDGRELASLVAGTIGTIGHSRYQSDVEVAFAGERIWTRGEESGGSYVCVVDARERRLLACSIQRR